MSDKNMQAIRAHDYGGPEVLVLEQAPRPEPKANEVLIRIKAAGVNPADWKYRSGAYKQFMPLQFPWTPGLDGSGVIESVGANVTAFKKGDEVYGIISSSYAEYALAKANEIQPKPASLTFEEAASLPVGALTAWGALIESAKIEVRTARVGPWRGRWRRCVCCAVSALERSARNWHRFNTQR